MHSPLGCMIINVVDYCTHKTASTEISECGIMPVCVGDGSGRSIVIRWLALCKYCIDKHITQMFKC